MNKTPWIQVLDEALVSAHLGIADETDIYEEAKEKLQALIDWHIFIALDPAMNGGYSLQPYSNSFSIVEAIGWPIEHKK